MLLPARVAGFASGASSISIPVLGGGHRLVIANERATPRNSDFLGSLSRSDAVSGAVAGTPGPGATGIHSPGCSRQAVPDPRDTRAAPLLSHHHRIWWDGGAVPDAASSAQLLTHKSQPAVAVAWLDATDQGGAFVWPAPGRPASACPCLHAAPSDAALPPSLCSLLCSTRSLLMEFPFGLVAFSPFLCSGALYLQRARTA